MYDDERPPTRRERRRRIIASIVAILAALALIIVTIAPALAASDHQQFNRYWMGATAHADGSIDVEIDLEFDFGTKESHGVYLTYLTRQRIEGDPEHYRVLEYSDIRAASPTAPDDVRIESDDDGIGIYVGDPDVEITGTHEYTIHFTVEGVVNSGAGVGGKDEIFWNIIGTGYEQHIDDVRVTLHGPAPATQVACWYGDFGSDTTCNNIEDGGRELVFSQTFLEPGEGLTTAAAYDPGTFNDVEPILTKRSTFANTMGGPRTAAIAGAASVALAVLIPLGLARIRRDERYLGITPGQFPPNGASAPTGPAPREIDPAVQFTPPAGLAPSDAGRIIAAANKPKFTAATLVDLAVRGFIQVRTVEGKRGKTSWDLLRTYENADGLSDREYRLLDAIFKEERTMNLEQLPSDRRKEIVELAAEQGPRMKTEGWFTTNPGAAKNVVAVIAGGLLGLGILATILAAFAGYGLLGIPIIVAGIALMFSASRAPKRTAQGYAYYVQSLGFKKYLETAEAGQLRFEAGEDIFSKYLPYAMVFGVVDRWVAIFEELSAQGQYSVVPAWYTGSVIGASMFSSSAETSAFTSSLTGLESAASLAAMTAPTTGSGGGSGFSGGGFSGGGVGGGGGGSW